jgi:uncharacterized protein
MPTLEDAHSWYSSRDPVHGLDHVVRVYNLAERLAKIESADVEIVRAAALLHDTSGGLNTEIEGESGPLSGREHRIEHHIISAQFAEQVLEGEGWPDSRIQAVQHCIRAHRFRGNSENPTTIEAKVLFDADKLDAIGAIGAARAVAYAARADQPIYAEPSDTFLATGVKTAGEAHSAFHENIFKLSKIKARLYTASGKAMAEERHRFMMTYFERLAAEVRGEI